LYVKSQITAPAASVVTVENNGLNDFKIARLFYENKLIEEVDHVGIATCIMNLVDYSGDISDTAASQLMWYPDTADSGQSQRYVYDEAGDRDKKFKDTDTDLKTFAARIKHSPNFNRGFLERLQLTKDNQIFCKFIPLKRLFRFCKEIDKVLKGEIRIVLEKNHLKNTLHATADGIYAYDILDLSLFIPEVEPSLDVLTTLEAQLSASQPTIYGWNPVQCFRSESENATSGTWRIVNSQHKVNAVYIAFSKVSRDNTFLRTNMIFDHNHLDSIQLRVNGKAYPFEEYRCNFAADQLDYSRVYSAFLAAGFKNQDDQGTCVSFKDFATLYPIIAFDLTKQEEDPWAAAQASEVEIRWRLSQVPEHYYIYAVVQNECKAEVHVLDKQIFLSVA
jgi:hypothetical protein